MTPAHPATERASVHFLAELDDTVALAVGRLVAKVWPRPGVGPAERAARLRALGVDHPGPRRHAPRSLVLWEDAARVVAHAAVFGREVATYSGPLTVMALAMVAADPELRGRGLGARVVRMALDLVDSGVFPFALFQTSGEVAAFYERLGCVRVENKVVNSRWTPTERAPTPDSPPFWDEVVMRYPAAAGSCGEAWPDGVIDLLGPGY